MYGFTDRVVDDIEKDLASLASLVWQFAEVGLQEEESAKVQSEYLAKQGFAVQSGIAGMPTAFVAEWGKGAPILGFLGEYDALAGVSQEVSPKKQPVVEGGAGHGCGHNLLGVGALGSAVALKRYLENMNLPGTVRYYGCPAEETLVGKVFMAKAGVYDDLDAAITWHPGSLNTVTAGSSNGMNSARFTFYGKTAHAAGDPHNGRSALDAVELMNIGANYLREHVVSDARIHYVITDGGGQPNVVPARAQVWYYVRAPHRPIVVEIYDRLMDVARGAALMTGTTFDVELLAGCYDVLPNQTLSDRALEHMRKVGPPVWTEEEKRFAEEIAKSVDKKQKDAGLRAMGAPSELYSQVMNETVIDPLDKGQAMAGSTDVGDVSWIVPTLQVSAACWPIGTPGHSWQITACSGHSLGMKGTILAAKVMARVAVDLCHDQELKKKAWQEFSEKTALDKYVSPLPDGATPPVMRFK
jgi:aminobenzoyl-glutamate utilization protein B